MFILSTSAQSKEVVKPENTNQRRLKAKDASLKVFHTVRVPSPGWTCCSSRFRSALWEPEHASVKVLSIGLVHSTRFSGGERGAFQIRGCYEAVEGGGGGSVPSDWRTSARIPVFNRLFLRFSSSGT